MSITHFSQNILALMKINCMLFNKQNNGHFYIKQLYVFDNELKVLIVF